MRKSMAGILNEIGLTLFDAWKRSPPNDQLTREHLLKLEEIFIRGLKQVRDELKVTP